MGDMEEDRIYADRRTETVGYLATGQGVATVRVSSDRVGRFSLAAACTARDVAAAADGAVYVATDADVLVGPDEFDSLGFGPAVAVTTVDDTVLAADESGTVSRYADDEWTALGTVDDVRALSGNLVAAADGVSRVDGDELRHVGLANARDVAADGAPLAATDDGLYRLGNGWLAELEGPFTTVAVAGDAGETAHAATTEALYAREADAWTAVDLPVTEPVVDVAYGECVYAVTERGTFLVDADPETTPDGAGGWRSRSLGLPDVTALAVVSTGTDA